MPEILSFEDAYTQFNEEDDTDAYDVEKSEYVEDIRKDAAQAMRRYLRKKSYWCGGKIPPMHLTNKRYIDAVMKTYVIDALDVAFSLLEHKKNVENFDCSEDGWDRNLVLHIMHDCSKRGVSKCFAGGMLLVVLELCYNVRTIGTLERYNMLREKMVREQQLTLKASA